MNLLIKGRGLKHMEAYNTFGDHIGQDIWQITPGPGIPKIFSVPPTEPCVNEVFSIVTCIYRRFKSQAPERVRLVDDPGMSWKIYAGRCAVHTIDLCVSFALMKWLANYTAVRIINDNVRVCTTLNRDLKRCVWSHHFQTGVV